MNGRRSESETDATVAMSSFISVLRASWSNTLLRTTPPTKKPPQGFVHMKRQHGCREAIAKYTMKAIAMTSISVCDRFVHVSEPVSQRCP